MTQQTIQPDPGNEGVPAPLILTLHMDDASFAHYNSLRKTHFPPTRNLVPAHVILFHQLPAGELLSITEQLEILARQPSFDLIPDGLLYMGGGVAYRFRSAQLMQLYQTLSKEWSAWLIPQDKKPLIPHITVQNKVHADEARSLHSKLSREGHEQTVKATGFDLWYYRNGPWAFVRHFPFCQE